MYCIDIMIKCILDILGSPQTLLLLHHLYHPGVGSGQFQTSALCLQSAEDVQQVNTTVACSFKFSESGVYITELEVA